ncbi:TlpA disulfide reductase family protein [Snuella sedimenti]|uniref:Redoxin domain-containing protein n=1 Tax=Snuella sedimenti TaxID=2798802 RepID=A0A8J7LTA2_9FLAO|nr:TlpA disulfide reductase family protein [Snuella sedimenti]MBJ6368091.1 redoxin domain-containing protein [Snuella sedimenti]
MRKYAVIGLVAVLTACIGKNSKVQFASNELTVLEQSKTNLDSIKLDVFDFNGLKPLLNKKDDAIYVINFWATWCRPCVKELLYFEKLNREYAGKNVKVILVSLDFPHLYDSKLKPFIKDRKIKSKVVALDDADMNSWIPQVNEAWSGAIPATVIYRNDKRKFFEKSFTYEELENEVALFLK